MSGMVIAIIPARSGSKGVPKKNIKILHGHPLLAYSIAVAKLSKHIDRIIVSTDDPEIANIAKRYQAEVPFLRPKELAQDNSLDIEFMLHALSFLKDTEDYVPDLIIHLRPTTPLRLPEVVDDAIEQMLKNKEATSLVSGHDYGYPAHKLFRLDKEYVNYFGKEDFDRDEEYYNYPHQILPKTYLANGYVDIILPSTLATGSMHGKKMCAFVTEKTADIDTIEDFESAKIKVKNKIYSKLLKKLRELKINKIGIMQGRLLPPIDNVIQAFPVDSWKKEFKLAKELGLDCIELIFELPNIEKNPLYTSNGIAELKQVIKETGVNIYSVCADYFMSKKLFRESPKAIKENISVLHQLIDKCSQLSIHTIVIPCVDRSNLKTNSDIEELVNSLSEVYPKLEKTGINLSLETSLPPQKFKRLIDQLGHPNIGINFDSGNSAALGYSPAEEFGWLADYINHIHIKDRIKGGGTVPLGKGNTDFENVFRQLKIAKYSGIFILQAARGSDELKVIADYKKFLTNYISKSDLCTVEVGE